MALSLDQQVEAVRSALWRACRTERERIRTTNQLGYDDDCVFFIQNIYDEYAVVRLGNTFYEVDYTVAADAVTIADRATWRAVEQTWTATAEVKALGAGRVGAYVVLFGSPDQPDLSPQRDYFTKSTDFWLERWNVRPMLYDHTLGLPADFEPVVGEWEGKTAIIDTIGVWMEGELSKAHKYHAMVQQLVDKGQLKVSSDSAPHLVRRQKSTKNTHEVTRWPIIAGSLTTTPAEPRLIPVATIKAAYKSLGLPDPALGDEVPASTGATAQQDADARRAAIESALKALETTPMTLQEKLAAARAALAAGDFDKAEQLTREVKMLQEFNELETKSITPTPAPARLPFAADENPAADPAENPAVKMFSLKRFGEIGAACKQVSKELYGADYELIAYEKHRDFRRYIKTGQYDPRLSKVLLLTPGQVADGAEDHTVGEMKTTMVEAVDELGGYVVPEDRRQEMIERLPGMTAIRPKANVISTTRDRVTQLRPTGGNTRYKGATRVKWVNEKPTAGTAQSNMTFEEVGIPVHTVMVEVFLSRNLLEDGGANLVTMLMDEITTANAIDEDEQFLVGNGVGKPRGILNGVAANGAPFDSDIAVVNSLAAALLTADGLKKVPFQIAGQYRQEGASWIFNRLTLQDIALLKDSANRYLFTDNDNQLASAHGTKLLGYDYTEVECLPAIGANKYPVLFGNWKGYTIADRIGLSIERFLDSSTARENTVLFISRRRLGGDVTQGWRIAAQKVAA